MSFRSTSLRYGVAAQTIHWLTAILVLAAYLLGEGGPESRLYAPERASQLTAHETIGMLVLALLVIRILWRLVDSRPEDEPMPAWMRILSSAVHGILYLLLAAIPLTAIFGAWFSGHPIFFAGSPIGPFLGEAKDVSESLLEIHETLGNVILWIAGLHALAAIYHHVFLRDRVLLTMLPFGRAR
jgi:cytochrome b561